MPSLAIGPLRPSGWFCALSYAKRKRRQGNRSTGEFSAGDDLGLRVGDFPIFNPPVMQNCPDCYEAVPDEARRCGACGRWLRDCRGCPQCGETVLEVARVCRFCGYDLVADPLNRPSPSELVEGLPHTLSATPLGGMICEQSITALFLPPRLEIGEEEIFVTKWTWLGLRSYRQRVSLARVASVRLLSGVIWAGVVVETFGGSISDLAITGLDKTEARETAALLEKVTQAGKKAPSSSQER